MVRKHRLGCALLATVLIMGMAGPTGPANAAGANHADQLRMGTTTPTRADAGGHTVTLLSGDRVTVTDTGSVAIHRGKGRQDAAFLIRRENGHVHVVPVDALPLLRAGRLDARLFDVTTLINFRYDDTRGDLPLIFTSDPAARSAAPPTPTGDGVTVVRELPAVGGVAVRADKDGVGALWQRLAGASDARTRAGGVAAVWLDGLRQPSLDVSVPRIGAPTAWRAGLDGAGVKVAVLDTGVDASHPDLAGQVATAANFTEGVEDDKDRVGHGTHVASTIAGTGKASAGKYVGVAPRAKLLAGKVCASDGCAESWILAGMQWAAEQGADVVNMSLGGPDTLAVDPVEQAVNDLTDKYGTLFVVAVGNDEGDAAIASPASADAALAVAAVTKSDEQEPRSNRGPRIDGALKPDIAGPGVDIVAARSADGFLGEQGESYLTLSGTSMATPHVAGAAAILAQRHPDATPEYLKGLLMASAKPAPKLGAFVQGAGRVEVANAITQTVVANPPSVGFGRARWPHGDDTPIARTITYRNPGPKDLTLALSTRAVGPDGKPAPAGGFTLDTSSVTVPAGGEASVRMTADTRIDGPDGYYTGQVTATGSGATVITPFAVDREVESYDVTVRHIDRAGKATSDHFGTLVRVDAFGYADLDSQDGTTTVRVPKGTYALSTTIFTPRGEDPGDVDMAAMAQPMVSVTKDQTLTMDARRAKPVSITVPRADASLISFAVVADVYRKDFEFGFSIDDDSLEDVYTAQVGSSKPYPWFRSFLSAMFGKVNAEGDLTDSPFLYHLSWKVDGRMFTGATKRVRQGQLATVRAAYARQSVPNAQKYTFPDYPGVDWGIAAQEPVRLPSVRTEYFNTEGKVSWQGSMDEVLPVEDDGPTMLTSLFGPAARYEAGQRYTERWNRGVFSPSLADPVAPMEYLTRAGDMVTVAVPTHSDGEHRAGFSSYESASVSVYRDGTKVGAVDGLYAELKVPADAGRYRVESQLVRSAPAVLSTKINTAWEFDSQHVAGDTPKRMPISVVRFSPDLSQHNTVRAGSELTIPVTVQRQPDSAAAPCATLTVQVSYDDGGTWRPVRLTNSRAGWNLLIRHPDQAGFVSLRAVAKDTAGNTVEQTIIRAYRIVR